MRQVERTRKSRKRLDQYAQYERSRTNLPHRVEARRKYQEEHQEQISEYKKNWAANNSESVARSKGDYYQCNRDEVISRSRKWAEDNAEKVKIEDQQPPQTQGGEECKQRTLHG